MNELVNQNQIIIQDNIKTAIENAIESIKKRHKKISEIKTPKRFIEQKMSFDYVAAPYIKSMADKHYPGWSWKIINFEVIIVNDRTEAVVIHGRLKWYEDGLWREGDMVAAHRIQYKKVVKLDGNGKGMKDANGNWMYIRSDELVDMGNDIKAGNTDCMKKAFSVFLNIADDVYKAHIDDLSLNNNEVKTILTLAKKIDREKEFQNRIDTEEINKSNYEFAIERLNELISEVK